MDYMECEFYSREYMGELEDVSGKQRIAVDECGRPKYRLCPLIKQLGQDGAPVIGLCPAMTMCDGRVVEGMAKC